MTRPITKLDIAEPLPTRPAICIRDLHKTFGQLVAIDDVSIDIEAGSSSRSSARPAAARPRCCASSAGLETVTSGEVEIADPTLARPQIP